MKSWVLAVVMIGATTVGNSARSQALTPQPWGGDKVQAVNVEAAYLGDVTAQVEAARRLEAGDGVTRDREQAADFWAAAAMAGRPEAQASLRRLAETGSPNAQMYLGRQMLSEGDRDATIEGASWLRKAGDAGSAKANFILASVLAASPQRGERLEAVVRYARAGATDPNLKALSEVLIARIGKTPRVRVVRLAPGLPLPNQLRGRVTKAEMLDSLAHWGLTQQNYLENATADALTAARLFEVQEGLAMGDPVAEVSGRRWLRKACSDGKTLEPAACAALIDAGQHRTETGGPYWFTGLPRTLEVGKAFELGVGTPVNYGKARTFYGVAEQYAAEPVRAEVEYRLARMDQQGLGKPKDLKSADEHLRRAAMFGHVQASYVLGLEALKAPKTREQWLDVGHYLSRAAQGGVADAAYRYAELVRNGNKVEDNAPGKALFDNYMIAATGGNVRAVFGLGQAYWNGWGVPVDSVQAGKWFERAARAGDPEAAWWAGAMYLDRRDAPGAIPWMRRAAQGGYPGAQEKLNEMLAKGYKERNLGGFLASVFEFAGEVIQATGEQIAYEQQQYQARLDAEMRFSMMVTAAIRENGGYTDVSSGGASGGPGSEGSGSTRGADSGGAGSPSGGAGRSGGSGGDGDGDGGLSGNGGGGSGNWGDRGSHGLASDGGAGGAGRVTPLPAGSAAGGGVTEAQSASGPYVEDDSNRFITVSDSRESQRAYEAEQARLAAELEARMAPIRAAEHARYQQMKRDEVAMEQEAEDRRYRAMIACYGSYERMLRAKVSCE